MESVKSFDLPAYDNHTSNELLSWIDHLKVTFSVRKKHCFGSIENDGLYLEIASEPDTHHPEITRIHLISIFLPEIWQRHGLGTAIIHRLITFCDVHGYALFVGPFVTYQELRDDEPTPLQKILYKIGGFFPTPPGLLYRKVRHVNKK